MRQLELPRRPREDYLLLEYLSDVVVKLHLYDVNHMIELSHRRFGHRKAQIMASMLEAGFATMKRIDEDQKERPEASPQGGDAALPGM